MTLKKNNNKYKKVKRENKLKSKKENCRYKYNQTKIIKN